MKIGSFRHFVRKIIHMKMFRFIFSLDFATLDLCLHSRWWNAHKRTNNILRTRHSDILYLSHLLFPLFNAFEIKNFSKQRKNEPINKINCFSLIEMFAVIWKVRFHIHIMHTHTHTHNWWQTHGYISYALRNRNNEYWCTNCTPCTPCTGYLSVVWYSIKEI